MNVPDFSSQTIELKRAKKKVKSFFKNPCDVGSDADGFKRVQTESRPPAE